MDRLQAKPESNKSQQLSISAFCKISLLLLITNFMVTARLHMFDESVSLAQQFLNNKPDLFQTGADAIYVPKLSSFSDMLAIFTNLNLQANYLFPLVLEISTLCVALGSVLMDKIYFNLLVCLGANLVAFLLMWLNNQGMLIYRLTYITQAMLIYPQLITSSFGFIRLFPRQLFRLKGYYACLMFMLPQISIPFSYWCMHTSSAEEIPSIQLLYSSTLKFITFGSLITFLALYTVIENRESIAYTLEIRFRSAIENANLDPSTAEIKQFEADKQSIKAKLRMVIGPADFAQREASKVFENKEDTNSSKKEVGIRISREKLGVLITACGLGISVGKQLPELKKLMLTNLIQNNSIPEIQVALRKSAAGSQLLVITTAIILTLAMVVLIRRKKFGIFKIIGVNFIIGYGALMILFLVSNEMIRPSLWMIDKSIAVGRIFFLTFIIPSIMLIEQGGMNITEGTSILFVMGWAFELILRIVLLSLEAQARLFALAVIAVGCCYVVEKIGKESKGEEGSQYNKIKQGVELEMEIETAAREQQESIEAKIEQELNSSA